MLQKILIFINQLVLHNYFADLTKLFLDFYLAKFLDYLNKTSSMF